jgi:hypothetical protein
MPHAQDRPSRPSAASWAVGGAGDVAVCRAAGSPPHRDRLSMTRTVRFRGRPSRPCRSWRPAWPAVLRVRRWPARPSPGGSGPEGRGDTRRARAASPGGGEGRAGRRGGRSDGSVRRRQLAHDRAISASRPRTAGTSTARRTRRSGRTLGQRSSPASDLRRCARAADLDRWRLPGDQRPGPRRSCRSVRPAARTSA